MLDIDIWNFIWSAVNLLLLFIVLKIFLFKPVNKIMDERTRSIQNDIDSAKKSMEEAEALKQQYTEDLSNAKEEARRIVMKAQDDAAAEKAVLMQRSKEDADKLVADANKAIENERRRVLQQAQSQIADLAIEAASKIIGENVDDEKNRRIVDKFLSEEGENK
ncbi:MAG TPA: F0F1 ATP synthase subunit B [Ruminococcus sp.]